MRGAVLFLFAVVFVISGGLAKAEESIQPYIDLLKDTMPEEKKYENDAEVTQETEPHSTYLERQKRIIEEADRKNAPDPDYSYIQHLKDTDPKKEQQKNAESLESSSPAPGQTYLEQERARLGPGDNKSAIQAFKEGRSELKVKIDSKTTWSMGLRVGVSTLKNITASDQVRNFSDVYSNSWDPDVTLVAQWQPLSNDYFGTLGIQGMLGMAYYRGLGIFSDDSLPDTKAGGTFGAASMTRFGFVTVPITLAASYRFNLFQVIRPYISVGATFLPYFETRNDGLEGNRGYSINFQGSGGIALALDYLQPSSRWDLYDNYGAKHFYITVEYLLAIPLASPVVYNVSGFYAGLLVEF